VLVPPWKLPRLSVLSGWAERLARAGYDVWTIIPPRHLSRAVGGGRSGEAFVSPDLPALRAAMEQLVLELRVLLRLARGEPGRVALVGLSLGGLAAALAATAPERADRVVAVAPPADLAAVAAGTRIGRRYLQLSARAGAPAPAGWALEGMLAPFRPAARTPTAGRVLVAVGDADRIALPLAAVALAARWEASLRRYPRGHLTLLFACEAVRRDVERFLGEG
jgi:pimeloyl-ACP methyl ester carboxylesterase